MTLRFGTDGVRGVANSELTPELVLAFGRAAARTLAAERFVIGRDTRRSGPLIESALCAGLAAEGVGVERLGVIPTPGVAWAAAAEGAAGAVVSASHNPARDNGIKLFAPGGRKLDTAAEQRLEATLDDILAAAATGGGGGAEVGGVVERPDVAGAYAEALCATVTPPLTGMTIVLDCAHGAASAIAPAVFEAAGAAVRVINNRPDGLNINEGCGSTDTAPLAAAVSAAGADAGLAFDGDADRVVAVDGAGRVVDGDHIIAVLAAGMHERGVLRGDAVAVTVMTNLGFRRAMAARGIRVVETPVGDRHVLEALEREDISLGGEQSGHVIFRDLATTGDGLLTGLQLLDAVRRSGRSLAELAASAMTRVPQVLRNVRTAGPAAAAAAAVAGEAEAVEAELGERGRVLVRPSGTEPVVRVMVEAPTEGEAQAAAARLVRAIEGAGA